MGPPPGRPGVPTLPFRPLRLIEVQLINADSANTVFVVRSYLASRVIPSLSLSNFVRVARTG
jgi:hypothetical protein